MIEEINSQLENRINQLLDHSIYNEITTPRQLKTFMEHHVFAVWDFMSLLKALQEEFTTTSTPWIPVGNPEIRFLINDLLLSAETDINLYGKHQSYFEMYLDAMSKSGANTSKIKEFLNHINHGTDIYLIIATSKLPLSIKQFLKKTFEIISEEKPHKIAAAFTFGRQDLIPRKFISVIENIQINFPQEDLQLYNYYFHRKLTQDSKQVSTARKMTAKLCGNDIDKWSEVKETAEQTVTSRITFWDGVEKEIINEQHIHKTGRVQTNPGIL